MIAPASRVVPGQRAVIGTGVVGARIARMAGAEGITVATDVRSLSFAAEPEGRPRRVVILATGGTHVSVAAELLGVGVSVVSVADDPSQIAELRGLDELARAHGASMVVGAAMAPGCSGLLARYLAGQMARCDEIHIAVHATAGPACARQHHRALAGTATNWLDGSWVRQPAGTGRELCWFPEPVGAHDCYRAEMADPLMLQGLFPGVRRVTARMAATRRDRLTARLPMLRSPHPEGGIGALRVEVRGTSPTGERVTAIAGLAEFVGAAAGATALAFARAIGRGEIPTGAVVPGAAALPTGALLAEVAALGVRLQEFSGIALQ